MGRNIPIQLSSESTTTCYLLKVTPVIPGYAPYGVTSLDQPVFYDDGVDQLLYSAAVGTQPTAVQTSASLAVDNAEAKSLMPEFDIPIREEDIRAGVYDFAKFDLYLVDYLNLIDGHVTVQSGTLGQITIDDEGLSYVNELRGLSASLKQSICQKDSLSCRAIFGSQAQVNSNGSVVERFPCGFDAESLLIPGAVSNVGLENTITFTVAPFSKGANALAPGFVEWVTGLNAGRTYEIDSNTALGVINLANATGFPIQVGDTLLYREDCSKIARDDGKGCRHWFGDDWVLHFRGEPDIPIGDAGSMETPGASSAPGQGGVTHEPFSEVQE